MAFDEDVVELVAKVIDAERAKSELEAIKATVKDLTDAEKDAMLSARETSREAARAQADHSGSVADVKSKYEQFNQVMEVFNRIVGVVKAGIEAYLAVLRNVIDHSKILGQESALLAEEWERLQRDFAQGVEEGGHLQRALRDLTGAAEDSASTARSLGTAFDYLSASTLDVTTHVGGLGVALAEFASSGTLSTILQASTAVQNLRRALGGKEGPVGPAELTTAQQEAAARASEEARAGIVTPEQAGAAWASQRAATERARNTRNARISATVRRGGGGGGGRREAALLPGQDTSEFMAQAMELLDVVGEQTKAYEEQQRVVEELYSDQRAALRGLFEDMDTHAEKEAEADRRRQEAMEQRMRMIEELREKEREAAEARRQEARQATEDFGTYASAVVSLGSTVGGVFDRLASEEEEGSEAAKKYGKVKGGIMAAIAFVQSAIEWAKGFALVAEYQYAAAASAFVSAAAYDVAGAMALRDLGGNATPAAIGGGASYVPDVPTEDRTSDVETNQGTNVVFYPWGMSGPRAMEEYDRANQNRQRSGIEPIMQAQGYYR